MCVCVWFVCAHVRACDVCALPRRALPPNTGVWEPTTRGGPASHHSQHIVFFFSQQLPAGCPPPPGRALDYFFSHNLGVNNQKILGKALVWPLSSFFPYFFWHCPTNPAWSNPLHPALFSSQWAGPPPQGALKKFRVCGGRKLRRKSSCETKFSVAADPFLKWVHMGAGAHTGNPASFQGRSRAMP